MDKANLNRKIKKAGYIYKNGGIKEFFSRLFKFLKKRKNAKYKINPDAYKIWIENNEPNLEEIAKQKEHVWEKKPLISLICPSYETKQEHFLDLVKSLNAQTYTNWELCVADGGSSDACNKMLKKICKPNQKIRFKSLYENLGIARNTAEAIRLSSGEILCFIDHDDVLAPFALFEIAKAVSENPRADFFYSDEDKLDTAGRYAPHFKPDYSPDTLKSYNYITHIMAIKRSLYDSVGGVREGFDGSQDHDLALRATHSARQVVHIPKVLYHWRAHANSVAGDGSCKTYAFDAGKRAVLDFCKAHERENAKVRDVVHGVFNASFRVRYEYKKDATVSIIIPNADKPELLKKCIDSIYETTQKNQSLKIEIIILENNSKLKETHEYYKTLIVEKKARIIESDGEFNYSAANNAGAKAASGEFLLFLNNDVQAIVSGWLEAMIELAARRDVGAVGAKLLYKSNKIQHCGVVVGMGGWADHVCAGLCEDGEGVLNANHMINTLRNVSAVTAACMMIEKYKFDNIGGFDEDFVLCGSDVELCLRLLRYDYVNLYTPFARLFHIESETRKNIKIPQNDYQLSFEAYQKFLINGDPLYSINFDYSSKIPQIAQKIVMPIELNSYYLNKPVAKNAFTTQKNQRDFVPSENH